MPPVLDRVTIEARRELEVEMELLVNADSSGAHESAAPTSGIDRSSGKPRSTSWRRLPGSSRWNLPEWAAPVFVWATWILMTVGAHGFLFAHADPVPYMDDYAVVGVLSGDAPLTPRWLWRQHNEHRIPLPLVALYGLVEWTRDFRSPMHAQVVLLAAASLGMILAARRIRRRTSVSDAFFPFLFLHWGHHADIAWAFGITVVLPAALASTVLILVTAGPAIPDRRSALWIGICLLLLPLCGGAGFLQAPLIAAWLGLAGVAAWRSRDPTRARNGPLLVFFAAAALGLLGFYLYDYRTPQDSPTRADLAGTLVSALRMLTMGAGSTELPFWPVKSLLWVALGSTTLVLLIAAWRELPGERWRVLGIASCGGGSLAVALGIGWARGAYGESGAALRYVPLAAPFLALGYLTSCLYGPGRLGSVVRGSMCVGMGALVLTHYGPAVRHTEEHRRASELLVRDVEAGLIPEALAERHWRSFFPSPDNFAVHLGRLERIGLHPYREPAGEPSPERILARLFHSWKQRPIEARSDQPLEMRHIAECSAIVIHAPGEILLAIPSGAHVARGAFGVDPRMYWNPTRRTRGVRFSVERVDGAGGGAVLFEQLLDPAAEPLDARKHEFKVELPPGAGGTLVLRLSSATDIGREMDWGYWCGIEID